MYVCNKYVSVGDNMYVCMYVVLNNFFSCVCTRYLLRITAPV